MAISTFGAGNTPIGLSIKQMRRMMGQDSSVYTKASDQYIRDAEVNDQSGFYGHSAAAYNNAIENEKARGLRARYSKAGEFAKALVKSPSNLTTKDTSDITSDSVAEAISKKSLESDTADNTQNKKDLVAEKFEAMIEAFNALSGKVQKNINNVNNGLIKNNTMVRDLAEAVGNTLNEFNEQFTDRTEVISKQVNKVDSKQNIQDTRTNHIFDALERMYIPKK
jgi:phage-related minor tail protein